MHGHGKIGKVPVSDTYTARSDTDTNVSNMHPAKKIWFFIPGTARTRPDTAEQKKRERERELLKNLAFFPAIQGPSTHHGGETLTLSFSLSGRRTSSLLLAFSDPNIIFSRALVLGFSFVGLFCTVGTLSLIWALFGWDTTCDFGYGSRLQIDRLGFLFLRLDFFI